MRDIAAVPHGADHIEQRLAGDGAIAVREFAGERLAGEEHRAVAVIEMRQHRVIGDEGERQTCEYDAQMMPMRASRLRSSAWRAISTSQTPRNSQSG